MTEEPRKRIDYQPLPDGGVKAIVTFSFPGGVVKRFEADVSKAEMEAVEGDIIGAECAISGLLPSEIGFSFGKLIKGVGKIAKGIASSKVFQIAAKGLALAAPLLGPIAPVALGAAAGMGVASKLAKAGVAAAKGAKGVAQALTVSAANDAKKLTKTPAGAAALLQAANNTRKGAEAVAAGKTPPKPAAAAASKCSCPPTPKCPAPQPAQLRPPVQGDLLQLAAAGRVRSNSGQPVSTSELLSAHQTGRLYWVS